MFTLFGAFASTFVHLFKGRPGQIVAGVVVVVLGLLLIGYAFGRGSIALYAERRPFLEQGAPRVRRAPSRSGWRSPPGGRRASGRSSAASSSSRRRESAAWGAFLLVCYSMGLGIPFIAIGLGAQWLTGSTEWMQRHYAAIAGVSGGILVVLGVMIATGEFTRRLAPLVRFSPWL